MTGSFTIKLKFKNRHFLLRDLSDTTTISELRRRIANAAGINENRLQVLVGYPPLPVSLTRNGHLLASTIVSNGDTIIVGEKMGSRSHSNASLERDEILARHLQEEDDQEVLAQIIGAASVANEVGRPEAEQTPVFSGQFDGILLKKPVAADHSCLFTSIRFVINGKADQESSEEMRKLIAQEVAADPEQYNDAVLGKPNAEYCEWIQLQDSWGGAIEISILSNYYGIEMDVVNRQSSIINRFGEDRNYALRVFLLFDGVHYDPLYMDHSSTGAIATIFPIEEMGVYQQALNLATETDSTRRYVDLDKFELRCLECKTFLTGKEHAREHHKETGHTNFGEI